MADCGPYYLSIPVRRGKRAQKIFKLWFYADHSGTANGYAWMLFRMASRKYRNMRKRRV